MVGRLRRAELHRFAKFGRKRSKCGRDMAIFRFFKMVAAAILDFSNLKFLTVAQLKGVELHHHARFSQTVAEIWRFFYFSNMAAVRHLGFVVCVRTAHEGHLVVFIAVQNLVAIDAVVLTICMFFDFMSGLKMPIHAAKMGFLGGLTHYMGAISSQPPKGTSGCRNTSYEPLSVKITLKMWPVGVMKNG